MPIPHLLPVVPIPLSQLDALARLLDDPAPPVRTAVDARLAALSDADFRRLRNAVTGLPDSTRAYALPALHRRHVARIERSWRQILAVRPAGARTLERGALVLARYGYPDLRPAAYHRRLDELAAAARPAVAACRGADRADALASMFYGEFGFLGNKDDYYAPENSYLNWVLDNRRGIPVSLGIVYLLVGRRLSLPIYGVNTPAHFLVKYHDEDGVRYFDLFNGRAGFGENEALHVVQGVGMRPFPRHLRSATVSDMLRRLVRNLVAIAHESDQPDMVADLGRLLAPADVT